MSVTATSYPRWASIRAIARPRPPPAPVTRAEGIAAAYGSEASVDNRQASPLRRLLGSRKLSPSPRCPEGHHITAGIGGPSQLGRIAASCRVARSFSASPSANPVGNERGKLLKTQRKKTRCCRIRLRPRAGARPAPRSPTRRRGGTAAPSVDPDSGSGARYDRRELDGLQEGHLVRPRLLGQRDRLRHGAASRRCRRRPQEASLRHPGHVQPRGRSVTATVIDRGPYRKGYAWDLTKKTAKRLGFLEVGAGPSRRRSPPPTGCSRLRARSRS